MLQQEEKERTVSRFSKSLSIICEMLMCVISVTVDFGGCSISLPGNHVRCLRGLSASNMVNSLTLYLHITPVLQ